MPSEKLGLSCALSTPFSPDARVDTARLAEHARWCLAEGCDSITLFGTTGEGAAVGVRDRERSIKALLAAGIGPSRLLSGVTACTLDEAVAQARAALDVGLRALLLAPPFYFQDVSDDGLFKWFAQLFATLGRRYLRCFSLPYPVDDRPPAVVPLIGRLQQRFPKQSLA